MPVQMLPPQSPSVTQQPGIESYMHPMPWSQKSTVQGEPSSHLTGSLWQAVAGSQVSVVHALPSLQSTGVWWHVPVASSQVSTVQASWSSQSELSWQQPGIGSFSQPRVASLHESVVHTSWSSQSTGVPGSHLSVLRLHISTPLQKTPSLHVSVRLHACVTMSQRSSVHATSSLQSASLLQQPAIGSKWHKPVIGSQVSTVQTSPSSQTAGRPG
jgi:hypothetical protein